MSFGYLCGMLPEALHRIYRGYKIEAFARLFDTLLDELLKVLCGYLPRIVVVHCATAVEDARDTMGKVLLGALLKELVVSWNRCCRRQCRGHYRSIAERTLPVLLREPSKALVGRCVSVVPGTGCMLSRASSTTIYGGE